MSVSWSVCLQVCPSVYLPVYQSVWYILPTQLREVQTFKMVVPSAQSEEKSDLTELGLEEYNSFENRISDLNLQTETEKP